MTMTKTANVGRQFMELMQQYQESQETCESFEGKYELYDLYEDLSNLYYDNITSTKTLRK